MKYQTKLKIFEAQQYTGPEQKFHMEGVDFRNNAGLSGYQRKLGYVYCKDKPPMAVRPMDYVMIVDGEVMVMPPQSFEKSYEPLKEPKKGGKRKVVEDNSSSADALRL